MMAAASAAPAAAAARWMGDGGGQAAFNNDDVAIDDEGGGLLCELPDRSETCLCICQVFRKKTLDDVAVFSAGGNRKRMRTTSALLPYPCIERMNATWKIAREL